MAALLCPEDDRIEDIDGIKDQPCMSDIDWDGLEDHSVPAPMVPNIAAKEDVSNFNPEAEISGVDWANLEPYTGDDSWCADF